MSNSVNPFAVLTNDADSELENGSGKEVTFFQFKNLAIDAKVKLPHAAFKNRKPQNGTALFDCSSEYGYFVAGTNEGFLLGELTKLRSQIISTKRGEISELSEYIIVRVDEGEVDILCVSANQCQLFAATSNNALYVYNVHDIVKRSGDVTPSPVYTFNSEITCVRPNTEAFPEIVAVCTRDSECYLINYTQQKSLAVFDNVSSMCWAPEGQQLVCGTTAGSLLVKDINGATLEKIASPASMSGRCVKTVQWIDNETFFVIYTQPWDSVNDAPEHIHTPFIINRNATNDADKYTLLAEINPVFDSTIPADDFYLHAVYNLGHDINCLIVLYNAAATEISFVGRDSDTLWATWLLEPAPCLPVATNGVGDTYPVGTGIDFSVTERVTAMDKEKAGSSSDSVPPLPIVFHMTTEGTISAHLLFNKNIVNKGQRYSGMMEAKSIQDIPVTKNIVNQPLQEPTPIVAFADFDGKTKPISTSALSAPTSTTTPASAFATATGSPQTASATPKYEPPSFDTLKAHATSTMAASTQRKPSSASPADTMGAIEVCSDSTVSSNSQLPPTVDTFGKVGTEQINPCISEEKLSGPAIAAEPGKESTIQRLEDAASLKAEKQEVFDPTVAVERGAISNITTEQQSVNEGSNVDSEDSVVVVEKPRSQSLSSNSDIIHTGGDTDDEDNGDHVSVEFSSSDKLSNDNTANNDIEDDECQDDESRTMFSEKKEEVGKSDELKSLPTVDDSQQLQSVLSQSEKETAGTSIASVQLSTQDTDMNADDTEKSRSLTIEHEERIEEEKRIIEYEKRKAAEENQKAENERIRAEEARREADRLRCMAEEAILRLQSERREAQKAHRQAEQSRIEAEKERQTEELRLKEERRKVVERRLEEERKIAEESLQFARRDKSKLSATGTEASTRTPGLTAMAREFQTTCLETMKAVDEVSKMIRDNNDEIIFQNDSSLARKDLSYFERSGFEWKMSDIEELPCMTTNLLKHCDKELEYLTTLVKDSSNLTDNVHQVSRKKDVVIEALVTKDLELPVREVTETDAKHMLITLSEEREALSSNLRHAEKGVQKLKKRVEYKSKKKNNYSQLTVQGLQRTLREIHRLLEEAQLKVETVMDKDLGKARGEKETLGKDNTKIEHLHKKLINVQAMKGRAYFLESIAAMI